MPKKFTGENSKAVTARAKKASAKAEADEKKQKQAEDEYWKDDAKHVVKKQNKKEEAERKRQQQQQKKQEAAALLREEETALQKQAAAKRPVAKVTRSEVQAQAERRAAAARAAAAAAAAPAKGQLETPVALEENVNRLTTDGDEARTVEEAIAVLSVGGGDDGDRHPERRMKAAYKTFEEETMPRIKQENPGMRLSQLKHMLHKEWTKSPQNPHNQKTVAYNAPKGS